MGLFQIVSKINRALAIISGTIILIIGIFSIWGPISRILLSTPNTWSLDVSRYLLIWAIFLGSASAFQSKTHVSVDFVRENISEKWGIGIGRILVIFGYALTLVYVSVFAWVSMNSIKVALQLHKLTLGEIQIPIVYFYLAMLIGSVLMFITVLCIIADLMAKGDKYL